MKIYKLLVVAISILLTSCGFQLRQASNIPANFKTIYIASSTPFAEFETTLKNNLRSFGFRVVPDEKEAALIFTSFGNSFSNSGTPLTSLQANVYTFTYSTNYSLKTAAGNVIIADKTVSASHNATLTANEILGTSNQTATIKAQLIRDTIGQILNQIHASAVSDTLQKINLASSKSDKKT